MATLWGLEMTRAEILRRVGDIRQLASAQAVELADGSERGTRMVTLRNATGLEFSVVTDRGMSIVDLRYQGTPLPFTTAVGVVNPAYGEQSGFNWLRTWPAGFLTTCGLSQVGTPGMDGSEELSLHGRVAGIPAHNVSWGGEWQGDDYILWVQGVITETAMFGQHLQLTRRISTRLAEPRLWVEDRVENLGFTPAAHMFLQHINLGFPLVDSTARLELPAHTTEPRDDDARPGLQSYTAFQEPTPGYREQVFYHTMQPDAQGMVEVRLANPAFNHGQGLSVALRYALAHYPILVEWKQMGEGAYVVGLEPANCHVEGRAAERRRGTLVTLAPGEGRDYRLEIELV